ncbi:MAG TPA: DNA mismatch repair protein MutS [Candidatus Dojkabacteria bacterium]|nr:DNA mismatch repair protein MutS [Candidatus Dojkabacteria bacterium]HRP51206.1 DNA mismatch repair protein MutS [Candidatus Dojkabacteria bacterium]
MADTPMYSQYLNLKDKYPDCILLFRLGDFYEAFDEDAKTISKVLGITLTGRGKAENRIPMAGIPHHALKQYLPKLIKNGNKVALADQLEPATTGKLVKRDVVKVITAGTILDENLLREYENNYIAVIYYEKRSKKWGLAYSDLSTGEFKINEYSSRENQLPNDLIQELYRIRPAELIVNRSQFEPIRSLLSKFSIQHLDNYEFDFQKSSRLLLEKMNISSFKSFGIEKYLVGVTSAGVLYKYLENTQKTELKHIKTITLQQNSDYINLDQTTINSLELFYSLRGNNENSLFNTINHCRTAMGQRLLRNWLLRPLKDKQQIEKRYDNVSELIENRELLEKLISDLDEIVDVERLTSRLATGAINARDLIYFKNSLHNANSLYTKIKNSELKIFQKNLPDENIYSEIKFIVDLIDNSIKEEPAITITEGNIIKEGYDVELDKINIEAKNGRDYIKNLEASEKQKTGISSLKVGFNQVFGYYIEISKSNSQKAPDNYIRKQTLVNAERYITEELKKWEVIVLEAQSKASEVEYKIFEDLREKIINRISSIISYSKAISIIDVYVNFAKLSLEMKMIRSEITDDISQTTEFKNSRHIVVESSIKDQFIPNDVYFKQGNTDFVILTGPNMSGKSTYIRQVAILFILAQIGCFVPADYAKIVLTDRIFTRVGSADNLAGGESTFMVEMLETANILNNATEKSLIILDEIGRGTSTYDGLAIAWAVVEHIVNTIKARTLFATHYHELILLEEKLPGVKNYFVEVNEQGEKIIFMHKILPGFTNRSYGIYVAKISGIPNSVIQRADDILEELEENQLKRVTEESIDYQDQLSFISTGNDSELKEKIKQIKIEEISPLDALLKIKELQDNIED